MFDFRYHALSLAAVFIALAVGLLLGVTIGDEELVSSARDDVRDSLATDVEEARDEAGDLRERLDAQSQFAEEVYPLLVGSQLPDRRIGLVFLGDPSQQIIARTREALEPTGAELGLVAVVGLPPDLEAIAERAEPTRYTELPEDPDLLGPFGERIGMQLVNGGRLVQDVRPALLRSLNGELGVLDAVVVMRAPRELDGDAEEFATALEDGIAEGITDTGVPTVGVELIGTEPSQIGWYRDHDMSSVDDLGVVAGRAALVFALAGAEGAFGTKPTAQALLPPVIARTPGAEPTDP